MERIVHLVSAARGGDPDSFSALFERFQDMAQATAYSRLRDHHRAQDAVQEAFIQAFINLRSLKEPAAFPGWFRQIVLRQCIRIIRRKTLQVVPLDDIAGAGFHEMDPVAALEQQELKRSVHTAIHALPDSQRLAIILVYIHGYSYKEVAEYVGVPVTTVKRRLHLGRCRLHKKMVEAGCG